MATKRNPQPKARAQPAGTLEKAFAAVMDAGSSVVRSAEEFVGMKPKAKPRTKAQTKAKAKTNTKTKTTTTTKTKTKAKPVAARKSKAGRKRKAAPK